MQFEQTPLLMSIGILETKKPSLIYASFRLALLKRLQQKLILKIAACKLIPHDSYPNHSPPMLLQRMLGVLRL